MGCFIDMNEISKIVEERVSLTIPSAKLRDNSERSPTLALNRKLNLSCLLKDYYSYFCTTKEISLLLRDKRG